jgi:biotin transport system substrate-specific component
VANFAWRAVVIYDIGSQNASLDFRAASALTFEAKFRILACIQSQDIIAPMDGSKRYLILSALFTALTALGAQLRIPLPFVSITLQTFFVLLAGHLLGPIYGAASQLAYLGLGLIGLPVFSEGGGLAYVLKPTFGYLCGFPVASFLAGAIVHRGAKLPVRVPEANWGRLLLANSLALLAVFAPGVTYLWWNTNFVLGQALEFAHAVRLGFLVFLPGDLIKIIGVIWLYRALQPRLATIFRLSINAPTSKTATTIVADAKSRSGRLESGL